VLPNDFAFARRSGRPYGLNFVQEEFLPLANDRGLCANLFWENDKCQGGKRTTRTGTIDKETRRNLNAYRDRQALEFLGLEVHDPVDPISVEEQRIMLWVRRFVPHFGREPVVTALISTRIRSSSPNAVVAPSAVSSIVLGRPYSAASSRSHARRQDPGSLWVVPLRRSFVWFR